MVKVSLTDEDLAERANRNYFEEGEHEVLIEKAERGTTQDGKEYVEFTVKGHDDEQDTARLWFTTEKSGKYSLSILAGIAVHNQATDVGKEKVREAFKRITDTDEVDNKFLEKFKEMDAFFTVYKSDRTYTTASGETRNSYDKNILPYMPSPRKPRQTTVEDLLGGTPVNSDDVPFK